MNSSTQFDITASSPLPPESQLDALLQDAAISPLNDVSWIRVTGEDRVRWLNGMVTNSTRRLQPGEGNYNFLLSVQGRIQGDANVFARPDDLLMETSSNQVEGLMTLLDRFIIMDDVELSNIGSTQSGLLVAGPKAASLLQQIGLPADDLKDLTMRAVPWKDSQVNVLHAYSPLIPRYELWVEKAIATRLADALHTAGAIFCEDRSLEWLRMLEGTPQIGTDIRDRELPQETGQA